MYIMKNWEKLLQIIYFDFFWREVITWWLNAVSIYSSSICVFSFSSRWSVLPRLFTNIVFVTTAQRDRMWINLLNWVWSGFYDASFFLVNLTRLIWRREPCSCLHLRSFQNPDFHVPIWNEKEKKVMHYLNITARLVCANGHMVMDLHN